MVSRLNWIALVDAHRHERLVGLRIEADALDAADHDAGRLDRRAHLEAADVVERARRADSPARWRREQVPDRSDRKMIARADRPRRCRPTGRWSSGSCGFRGCSCVIRDARGT
jgi:hypothetical protein